MGFSRTWRRMAGVTNGKSVKEGWTKHNDGDGSRASEWGAEVPRTGEWLTSDSAGAIQKALAPFTVVNHR